MIHRLISTLLFLCFSGWLTAPVAACTVCYGAAKNSMIDGGQNAILFMLLLTYLLLGGGAFMMVVVHRRRTALSTRGSNG